MSVRLLLFTHLFLNISAAEDLSSTVCDSLESLKRTNSLETMGSVLEARSEIQQFLKNSDRYIEQKINSQNYEAIAIACGLIDEVTQGFTKPCIDNTHKVIDLQASQLSCENYLNK